MGTLLILLVLYHATVHTAAPLHLNVMPTFPGTVNASRSKAIGNGKWKGRKWKEEDRKAILYRNFKERDNEDILILFFLTII